jgi:SAM-dependent methyltransferase/uncharacterized protein YbaR (Trm112 family)
MHTQLLSLLLCPYCAGSFRISHTVERHAGEILSGILRCPCGEIPVLGGIPIFRREGRVVGMRQSRDIPVVPGPAVARLLELIRAGRAERALLLLVTVPPSWVRRSLAAADALPERIREHHLRFLEDAWIHSSRPVRELLLGPPESSTAADALDYYYARVRRSELHRHFLHRFGQPRHLTILGLASLLPRDERPVLDVGCGFGHTLHYWTTRHAEGSFVGLDRDFFELYVAKRWIAPRADYVLADADAPFPFRPGAFGGAFCSDAFHCFLGKRTTASELTRAVGDGGAIVLARFGNREVEPREGYELAPEEYASLFAGMRHAVLLEHEILARYLRGLAPDLSGAAVPGGASAEKWISLVVSRDESLFRDHGAFEAWPHAAGIRRVQTLYREVGRANGGDAVYELRMPGSQWFEFENGECREYMPERFTLTAEARAALERGEDHPVIGELVRRGAVVGMPERHG